MENLPAISDNEIKRYHQTASERVLKSATNISKPFQRGEAFVGEKYIDVDTVFTKETPTIFMMKAICSASKKQTEYTISLSLDKVNKAIMHAYCECPAGSGGLCGHSYGLMKLAAKWSIDRYS